ncbi:MAG: hypothetical protein K5751_03480 [Treponemataceae bacterium]|nr:hypothetical protein [Treponemataceae bacterium]
MSMIFKLAKLYLSQMLSFSSIKDGFTQGGKKALKSIGVIILILYCVGVFGFLYITIAGLFYSSLAASGMSHIFPLMLGFAILVITFIFGFLTTLGTYTSAQNEELLLSLPLKDKQLFLAKFISTSVCELPISFAFITIGAVIYAKNEGLLGNPLLYVSILVNSLAMPLIILAICYILVVLILNAFSFLKNKAILLGISTACLLIAVLGLNFSYQNLMFSAAIDGIPEEMLASVTDKLSGAGKILMPVKWFAESFSDLDTSAVSVLLKLLLLLASSAVFLFLILPLISPLYRKTIIGFNETSAKKLSKDKIDTFIQNDIKSTPILKALIIRDFKSLIREPAWLTNGPLIILLLPLIMGITVYISIKSNTNAEELKNVFGSFRQQILMYIEQGEDAKNSILYAAAGISAICAIFTGCNTFVAASAISREGKGLSNLMALPVSWNSIFTAKIIHAMIYSVFTTLLATIAMAVVMGFLQIPLSIKDIVFAYTAMIGFSLVFSFILQVVAMAIDTTSPKLDWENPSAALKRNMNTMFSMLVTMGIVVLIIAAGIFLLPQKLESILVLTLVSALLAIPLWKYFLKFAKKALLHRF